MKDSNTCFKTVADKYPRLAAGIELRWGDKEFHPYVKALIEDKRGDRQGFPIEVLDAIMALQEIHDAAFPHLAQNTNDVWIASQFGSL